MQSADEIFQKLKHYRKRILILLYRHGELRTRELREKAGFPSGSKEHHLSLLEEWGLIEEVGRTTESGGIPERVFGLTDEGREFVEEYLTEDENRPDSYEMRIERLEDEIDELKDETERLQDEIDELRESTVSEETFKEFVETVEKEAF